MLSTYREEAAGASFQGTLTKTAPEPRRRNDRPKDGRVSTDAFLREWSD